MTIQLIDSQQYRILNDYIQTNNRVAFYIALYEYTGNTTALMMSQISSSSGVVGGGAWAVNNFLAAHLGDYWVGGGDGVIGRVVYASQQIAIDDLNNIRPDPDNPGQYIVPSEQSMLVNAYNRWDVEGLGKYFPGNGLIADNYFVTGEFTKAIQFLNMASDTAVLYAALGMSDAFQELWDGRSNNGKSIQEIMDTHPGAQILETQNGKVQYIVDVNGITIGSFPKNFLDVLPSFAAQAIRNFFTGTQNGSQLTSYIGAGGIVTSTNPDPVTDPTRAASATFIYYSNDYTAVLKAGGTLSDIVALEHAKGNNISLDDLRKINGLTPSMDGVLQIGQEIIVPVHVGNNLVVNYGDVLYSVNPATNEYQYTVKNPDNSTTIYSHTIDSVSALITDKASQIGQAGNVLSESWVNSDSSSGSYAYDATGRLMQGTETDANGSTTGFYYNPYINLTKVIQHDALTNLDTVRTSINGQVYETKYNPGTGDISYSLNDGVPFTATIIRGVGSDGLASGEGMVVAMVDGKEVIFTAAFDGGSLSEPGNIRLTGIFSVDGNLAEYGDTIQADMADKKMKFTSVIANDLALRQEVANADPNASWWDQITVSQEIPIPSNSTWFKQNGYQIASGLNGISSLIKSIDSHDLKDQIDGAVWLSSAVANFVYPQSQLSGYLNNGATAIGWANALVSLRDGLKSGEGKTIAIAELGATSAVLGEFQKYYKDKETKAVAGSAENLAAKGTAEALKTAANVITWVLAGNSANDAFKQGQYLDAAMDIVGACGPEGAAVAAAYNLDKVGVQYADTHDDVLAVYLKYTLFGVKETFQFLGDVLTGIFGKPDVWSWANFQNDQNGAVTKNIYHSSENSGGAAAMDQYQNMLLSSLESVIDRANAQAKKKAEYLGTGEPVEMGILGSRLMEIRYEGQNGDGTHYVDLYHGGWDTGTFFNYNGTKQSDSATSASFGQNFVEVFVRDAYSNNAIIPVWDIKTIMAQDAYRSSIYQAGLASYLSWEIVGYQQILVGYSANGDPQYADDPNSPIYDNVTKYRIPDVGLSTIDKYRNESLLLAADAGKSKDGHAGGVLWQSNPASYSSINMQIGNGITLALHGDDYTAPSPASLAALKNSSVFASAHNTLGVDAAGNAITSDVNILKAGDMLKAGESITSSNGRFMLQMGADGNLTLVDQQSENGSPIWAAWTSGAGNYLQFGAEGSFEVFDSNSNLLWSAYDTGAFGIGGHNITGAKSLTLQDNGILTLTDQLDEQDVHVIAIDLNGDGKIVKSSKADGVLYDVDDDGFAEATEWVGPKDGILVLDRNGDGSVRGGHELFNDSQVNMDKVGLDALREVDANYDFKIDSSDAVYNYLQVWQDMNRDGVIQSYELKHLKDWGITQVDYSTRNGDGYNETGSVTMNGQSRIMTSEILQADATGYATSMVGNSLFIEQEGLSKDGRSTETAYANSTGGNKVNVFALAVQDLGSAGTASEQVSHIHTQSQNGYSLSAVDDLIDAQQGFGVTVLASQLLANDVASNGLISNLQVVNVHDAVHGVVSFQPENGRIIFTPDPGFANYDSANPVYGQFSYDVYDASTNITTTATVLLDVAASTALKLLNTTMSDGVQIDGATYSSNHVGSLIAQNTYDTTHEVSGAHFALVQGPVYGSLYLNEKTGAWTYTTTSGSDDAFTAIVQDSQGNSAQLKVIIDNHSAADSFKYLADTDGVVNLNSALERITSTGGNDTVLATVDALLTTTAMENVILQGSDALDAQTNAVANRLYGNQGDNRLDGGVGADTMLGGAGDDVYVVDNIGDVVVEYADAETVASLQAANATTLNADNTIPAAFFNLDGHSGFNTAVDAQGKVISNAWGHDRVEASISYELTVNVEDLTLTGVSNIDATGNELDNVINGNYGNNRIDGKAGADIMIGGAGDDTYVVDNKNDRVIESFDEGVDTVLSSVSYTLSANLENITLTGTNAINGTGNAGDNVLTGNSAANILMGGAGNDTYIVDNVGDIVVENLNGGIDTVQSAVRYTLSNNVENLVLEGFDSINGIGNGLDNNLSGNAENNELDGGAGNDVLDGGAGNDTLYGGLGNDVLHGGAGDDTYVYNWGEGADTIFDMGTPSLSSLIPFGGNDTLCLENGLHLEDLELESNGYDLTIGVMKLDFWSVYGKSSAGQFDHRVLISGQFTPIFNFGIENIVFGDGTSYSTVNWIVGDTDDDTLNAFDMGGMVFGGSGNDILNGSVGVDWLDGGFGADTLIGGDGSDTYVVDNLGDVVIEATSAASGIDTVITSLSSYTLGDNVENLKMKGASSVKNAIGNELNNVIDVFDSYNSYYGGAVINGLGGDDTIRIHGNHSVVVGGTGNDLIVNDRYANAGGIIDSTYVFNLGDGQDTIVNTLIAKYSPYCSQLSNYSYTSDITDAIQFGASIAESDITLEINNNDLIFKINGTTDQITVQDWRLFVSSIQVEFANGAVWDNLSVQAHVSALPIYGTDQADVIYGDEWNNTINGGAGNDTLLGGAGSDTYVFNLGDGQDMIFEGTSPGELNTIRFGAGIVASDITVAYNDNGDLVFSINGTNDQITIVNWGYGEVYQIQRVQFADGTSWPSLQDMFAIKGTNGDDYLIGTDWVETIIGGKGNDYLEGGWGNDTYVFNSGDGQDTIYDFYGELDTIQFGAGINASNITFTRNGIDLVIAVNGSSDQITVQGWGMSEQYHIEQIQFADGTLWNKDQILALVPAQDLVMGTENSDTLSAWYCDNPTLQGLGGDDSLNGNTGNDLLIGGAGDDALFGGEGDDTLIGGAGNDYLEGGSGNNVYLFNSGDGQDYIYCNNWSAGLDTIQFGVGISVDNLNFSFDGSNLVIKINGTTDQIYIIGWGLGDSNRLSLFQFENGLQIAAQDLIGYLHTVNHAPIVEFPIADQQAVKDMQFSFTVPAGSFTDIDTGDVLTYSATLADGTALPSWLSFDAATQTFIGTASSVDVGSLNLLVTATDTGGLSASSGFILQVDSASSVSGYSIITDNGQGTITTTQYDGLGNVLGSSIAINDGLGNSTLSLFDANGNILSDAWTKADGSHGSETFNADGSSSSNTYNSDGSYNTYTRDINGISIQTYFNSAGLRSVSYWSNPNGSSGSNTYNADGSYSAYENNALGSSTTLYDVSGFKLSDNWTNLDGSSGSDSYNADGSYTSYLLDISGTATQSYYNTTGQITIAYWSSPNGSSGSNTYNADGSHSGYSIDAVGTAIDTCYTTTGQLTSDNWAKADGTTGSDTYTYQTDGSYLQQWSKSDGSSGTLSVDNTGATVADSTLNVDGSQAVNASGNHLVLGTAADDTVTAQATGNEILIGGIGNDTLTTGPNTSLIAFNKGDGSDTLNAAAGSNNVLSLGGNFIYDDLTLQKNSNDLILNVSATDSITFKDWYAGNHNIVDLQVIATAMADYAPGSSDVLRNNQVEEFDFQKLVAAFDTAQAATPTLSTWSVTNALLDAHLSGSDTEALGGDLAFSYGNNGNLTGMGVGAAENTLNSSQFAAAPQTLNPWATLNTGVVKLG